MIEQEKPTWRRLLAAAALGAAGAALLASFAIAERSEHSASAARGASPCSSAAEPAAEASPSELRKSIRCLVNEERAVRGLDKVARVKSLKVASQRHARVMVKTDCLAHRCPGEDDLETRLREAGYFNGARMWRYAENTGCGASAEAMIDNWMDSRYHRVNILARKFSEVGVGVVKKPVDDRCERGYATFAAVFGDRELKDENRR
jgi:uncharacterized protein YkwD